MVLHVNESDCLVAKAFRMFEVLHDCNIDMLAISPPRVGWRSWGALAGLMTNATVSKLQSAVYEGCRELEASHFVR